MPHRSFVIGTWLAALVMVSGGFPQPGGSRHSPAQESPPPAEQEATSPAEQRALARGRIVEPWTGDLDGMIERGYIRVATVYSKTFYFIDRGVERGMVYESFELFQSQLNQRLRAADKRVDVMFLPIARDELIPWIAEGRADLAAGGLIVTPEREKLVDFTPPTRTNVSEIIVTGPEAPDIATLDDLAGQNVFVRKSSSYYGSLVARNREFRARGKKAIVITPAPEALETEDILEMVNAGLVRITVADDYLAAFWQQVFPSIKLHEDIPLRSGAHLAVALRKDSPQLMAAATAWIRTYGPRTTFGNMVTQRYLKSTTFVKDATSRADMQRFHQLVAYFRKYGRQYRMDPLLMAAQGYQESRLNQNARSAVGAIGVMQVTPATAKEMNVGDVTKVENNIHAGVKYIRFMIDQYYAGEPMDTLNRGLFAFAAYNAGPASVQRLRHEAETKGLDPNVWFDNVEQVAFERLGPETVTYVDNIYKYYVAYQLAITHIDVQKQLGE